MRRYDVDWLRVLVMLAVFFFHSARFFGGGTWHLNNSEESLIALIFIGWLDMWFMPFFFLLSGVGSRFALKSRSVGRFVRERVLRILVPLYTVGLFIMLPPQVYFEFFSNEGYQGTFFDLIPRYLKSIGHFSLNWPGGLIPVPFSGHLWFLQYLFLVSVVSLPLMLFLKSRQGMGIIGALAEWSERPGGVFLFLIPVLFVRIGLRCVFQGEHTWADFFEFMVFFLVGYIISMDDRFTRSIKKHGLVCLVLGLACFMGEVYFVLGLGYAHLKGGPFSPMFVIFESIMGAGRWCWMVFVLNLGARYLNSGGKILEYGNEAVLPFYILHQTVILCVGWFVIFHDWAILPKFLIIASVSFLLIMLIYESLIRRFNIMRFLFGMRPMKPKLSSALVRKTP